MTINNSSITNTICIQPQNKTIIYFIYFHPVSYFSILTNNWIKGISSDIWNVTKLVCKLVQGQLICTVEEFLLFQRQKGASFSVYISKTVSNTSRSNLGICKKLHILSAFVIFIFNSSFIFFSFFPFPFVLWVWVEKRNLLLTHPSSYHSKAPFPHSHCARGTTRWTWNHQLLVALWNCTIFLLLVFNQTDTNLAFAIS